MVTEEDVKKLAYAIWEQEGRPEGKDVEHYYHARQVLENQDAARVTELGAPPPILELPASSPTLVSAPPRERRGTTRRKKK